MSGFSYGGQGDGTNWSSERGTGPTPGGGSSGTGGNNGNNSSNNNSNNRRSEMQLLSIRSDNAVRTKLSNIMNAAKKIYPAAKLSVVRVTPEGTMVLAVDGLNADQAKQIGLGGLIMGFNTSGTSISIGDIETGHSYKVTDPVKNNYAGGGGISSDSFLSGGSLDVPKNTNRYQPTSEMSYIYTGIKSPMRLLTSLTHSTVKNVDTYSVYFKYASGEVTYKFDVTNGDLNNMRVITIGEENPVYTLDAAKKIVIDFASIISDANTDILMKASNVIISASDKVGGYLGNTYKALGREIAGNIKNFQGKSIRSYDDAMRSLNKILTNPNLKINAADKNAVVNAWQSLNADDLGDKFASLGKTFKVADYAMKANNVKNKSIEGYDTGDWGPLMREVESWVASGIAASVALGVFSVTMGAMLMWAGVPTVAVGLLGIIMASLIASLIDDKLIYKLNNEIIKPAY